MMKEPVRTYSCTTLTWFPRIQLHKRGMKVWKYLSESQFVRSTKERGGIIQQRFNLLDDGIDDLCGCCILLRALGFQDGEVGRVDFAEPSIHEERYFSSLQSTAWLGTSLQQVAWVRVDEELRYNCGFGEDLPVVRQWWHKTTGVDCEVYTMSVFWSHQVVSEGIYFKWWGNKSLHSGVLGTLMSTRTSSNSRPSSRRAIWARWAHGHWCAVYKMIFGAIMNILCFFWWLWG